MQSFGAGVNIKGDIKGEVNLIHLQYNQRINGKINLSGTNCAMTLEWKCNISGQTFTPEEKKRARQSAKKYRDA